MVPALTFLGEETVIIEAAGRVTIGTLGTRFRLVGSS
jgi:hypothetical protein